MGVVLANVIDEEAKSDSQFTPWNPFGIALQAIVSGSDNQLPDSR
jgi:hypothetical protein